MVISNLEDYIEFIKEAEEPTFWIQPDFNSAEGGYLAIRNKSPMFCLHGYSIREASEKALSVLEHPLAESWFNTNH